MNVNKQKTRRRNRRKRGIRKRIFGAPDRPRLTVFRSANHIYAQLIDDLSGQTLCQASTNERQNRIDRGGNCEAAKQIGQRIAERAKSAGVTQVAFDRNGFRYHGRVKALADAAREGGLKF